MNEALLYFIWQSKKVNTQPLQTTDGQAVEIVSAGQRNNNSGPDFFNAKVKIGDTLWAGNVEMHVKTSDWLLHGHQNDEAFKNVILHVVFQHDKDIGNEIPVLELGQYIPDEQLATHRHLMASRNWIPCADLIDQVHDITILSWLERMAIERLEDKTLAIFELLKQNTGNWEETMYQMTARYYGVSANRDTFELLARSLPHKILGKHKDQLKSVEALLYGQAGFLNDHRKDDTYYAELQQEFKYLQAKYQLRPLKDYSWKFMRMRPAAFPTIRIAQFAMLVHRSSHLFSQILETEKLKEIEALFKTGTSSYWNTHYRFGETSVNKPKQLGKTMISTITLNVVIPMLFAYGSYKSDQDIKNKALKLLQDLKPEDNHVIRKWAETRHQATSALESQALLQLKAKHCDKKACLSCGIGLQLIKTTASTQIKS